MFASCKLHDTYWVYKRVCVESATVDTLPFDGPFLRKQTNKTCQVTLWPVGPLREFWGLKGTFWILKPFKNWPFFFVNRPVAAVFKLCYSQPKFVKLVLSELVSEKYNIPTTVFSVRKKITFFYEMLNCFKNLSWIIG